MVPDIVEAQILPFNFYIIHNAYVGRVRRLLIGKNSKGMIIYTRDFLFGKEIFVYEDNFTYTKLFGFEKEPLLLQIFFNDMYFVMELCRKHEEWCTLFKLKNKCQFIPIPFQILGIKVKSMIALTKVAKWLDLFDIRWEEASKGFNPIGIFTTHLLEIRYTTLFLWEKVVNEVVWGNKYEHIDTSKKGSIEKESKGKGKNKRDAIADSSSQTSANMCSRDDNYQEGSD